jgi:hypothetical protein
MDKDIMYQDDLVCILRPNIKKGIIIWSNYTQPPNMESLSILGLKTGLFNLFISFIFGTYYTKGTTTFI